METAQYETETRSLPPLILHPFADPSGPGRLVESSRASLMLQGLLPTGEQTQSDLDRAVLDGRYCEIRMLFYVGKDLVRWIEQCIEFVDHDADFKHQNLRSQSFAEYLIKSTPLPVQTKLRKWGVADYKAIFTRALGLNYIFADVPSRESLSDDFVRNYYRYADQFFAMGQSMNPATTIDPRDFDFDLFASGEYSRMLERNWEEK